MESIRQTEYIKKNMTKEWLLSNGFRYNRLFSDDEVEVYTYRFPVYKYNKFTLLECELKVILGDDVINVNVYDYGTNDKYAPFMKHQPMLNFCEVERLAGADRGGFGSTGK